MTKRGAIEWAGETAVAAGARILGAGGLVAFPTETVYGLGADATNDRAVARIFEAKTRPEFNPLIVHVLDIEMARGLVHVSPVAQTLMERFWPGPLTLVLPRNEDSPISHLVSAGLETIAIRAPDHPVARALIAKAGVPLAAPSANRSGEVSPTRAEHVQGSLGDSVDLILDGGPCAVGIESTIVAVEGEVIKLLRPGGIPRADIEALIGPIEMLIVEDAERPNAAPTAPGQLRSHYAPRARLRLEAVSAGGDEALLAFGPTAPEGAAQMMNLSPTGDLAEAAANLFAMLRALDHTGIATIAVMPIPQEGLGEAINDRLTRAAAPRNL